MIKICVQIKVVYFFFLPVSVSDSIVAFEEIGGIEEAKKKKKTNNWGMQTKEED